MKKSNIVLLFIAIALMLAVPAQISTAAPMYQTQNQNQNQNQNQPRNQKKPTLVTIQKVTAGSITVKEAKKTTTYVITNLTEVDYKGQLAKVSDLKPGMLVVVTVGMNPADVDRISADDAPKKK